MEFSTQTFQYNFTNFTSTPYLLSQEKAFYQKGKSLIGSVGVNSTTSSISFLNQILNHANQIHVYVCTFLVIIGVIGNVISLLVFARSARHSPKITTRHSFILLSLSNLVYLLMFWYFSVLTKWLHITKINSNSFLNKINLVNSNVYICKSVMYTLHASICLNALVTVSFSLERAFAVNFPLKARNMRVNHHCLFKIIFICIIIISFVFPIYNLILLEVTNEKTNDKKNISGMCNVPRPQQKLYFKLTLLFVIKTLAIPFIVITISNISIVIAIYKNKKLLDKHKKEKNIVCSQPSSIVELPLLKVNVKNDDYAVVYRNTFVKKKWCITDTNQDDLTSHVLPKSISSFSANSFSQKNFRMNQLFASFNSSNKSSNHSSSLMLKNESLSKLYAQNNLRKHLMVTKMLVPISSSFVLFQLPYFVSWCILAINELNRKNEEDIRKNRNYFYIVRLTEILNLFYYSIASFLLFSGKTYRKHLYALFCSISRPEKSFKLQREINNSSKKIEIVRL